MTAIEINSYNIFEPILIHMCQKSFHVAGEISLEDTASGYDHVGTGSQKLVHILDLYSAIHFNIRRQPSPLHDSPQFADLIQCIWYHVLPAIAGIYRHDQNYINLR